MEDEELMAFLKNLCQNLPVDHLQACVAQNMPPGASVEERNSLFHSAMQVFETLKS